MILSYYSLRSLPFACTLLLLTWMGCKSTPNDPNAQPANNVPELTTSDATDVSLTSFAITGKLTGIGSSSVTQYGHVLSATNQTPTVADTKTELGTATSAPKEIKSTFGNLSTNTAYYVRAYATNASGTGYSEVKTLKTNAEAVPTLTTLTFEQIGPNAARANGTITNGGTRAITQYGHVWSSTNQTPTISDAKSDFGSTTAPKDYVSGLPGLTINTTYYVRAYATSAAGTGYGEVKTFKTLNQQPPTVNTGDISNITLYAASVGMNLLTVGSNTNIQAGLCWSSSNQTPTTADTKTSAGANSAPQFFGLSLTNLTPATTYYVRAFATSNDGTGYGDVKTFKTAGNVPTVETQLVSSPKFFDASFTGRIVTNAEPTITQYGHVWSKDNQNPTTNDTRTQLGSTKNAGFDYVSDLRNLNPGTTYYVRAYAINTVGTAYGAVKSFATQSGLPTVQSLVSSAPNVGSISALVDGKVLSAGAATVTQFGHCWSTTNKVPTTSDTKTEKGSATIGSTYFSEINNLPTNTTYYVRGYATNSYGTAYGDVITFTTRK